MGGSATWGGIYGIHLRGGGFSPSPVPSPYCDSHHGPLHGDKPKEGPGPGKFWTPPALPGKPSPEPLPGTAFHWVSPRTAPAPRGGGGGRRPGGVGLRVSLPGETGEGGLAPSPSAPPPGGIATTVHCMGIAGLHLLSPAGCLQSHLDTDFHRPLPFAVSHGSL
jgi:hypothetical protein